MAHGRQRRNGRNRHAGYASEKIVPARILAELNRLRDPAVRRAVREQLITGGKGRA